MESDLRRMAAELLLDELEQNRLTVILVPAPQPRHESHFIRVASERNPWWFRSLNTHQEVRRDRTLAALTRIVEGKENGGADEKRLQGIIERQIEAIESERFTTEHFSGERFAA